MTYLKNGIMLVLLLSVFTAVGQHCGTSFQDQAEDNAYVKENRAEWSQYMSKPDGAITYIPVKFHRVYKRDGSEAISYASIFGQLCQLNTDYEQADIQFYLKDGLNGILDLQNDEIYENPSTTRTAGFLRSSVNRNKDAINIFINNTANSGSGGPGQTLGFYNRVGDYIVIKKTEVQTATHSLSHELGHFFGLSHTFYGWEGTEYDCNNPTPQQVFLGGSAVLVEYVDRNRIRSGRPLCQQAADGFCDTQADYNLGFGFSGTGCNYTGCAKDPENASLMPNEENMMGYFLSCLSTFSPEQGAVMLSNIASTRRSYIRSSYVPDLNTIPNTKPEIEHPLNGAVTQFYDKIELRWKAVPGISTYLVEVDTKSSLNEPIISEYVNGTSLVIEDLNKAAFHFWQVRPVTEYQNCLTTSGINRFRTSTATKTIDIAFDQTVYVISNPATIDQPLIISAASPLNDVHIDIKNLAGQSVLKKSLSRLESGVSYIDATIQEAGIYLVTIHSGNLYTVKKWVVQ